LPDLSNIAHIKIVLKAVIIKKKGGRTITYRSRHEIISQILNACKKGASKTRIIYQANLNFNTVNPYLDLLIKNKLIEKKTGRSIFYETTERGNDLSESLEQLKIDLA